MKQSIRSLSFLGLFLSFSLIGQVYADTSTGSGVLELEYYPIVCVTTPCPQFKVLRINKEVVSNVGADLINVNPSGKAFTVFKKFTVKGSWKRVDDYLEVTASEWRVTIKEKIDTK